MDYEFTNQRDLRRAFWAENPQVDRRKIQDYTGHGKMYCADTRVTWCDWIDYCEKAGRISPALAYRATLGD